MAYREFNFPSVVDELRLNYHEDRPLFPQIQPVELPASLLEILEDGRLVTQRIDNEKARSEFIIAPLFMGMWRASRRKFGIYSGSVFDVDPQQRLNGYVDFLLTCKPLVSLIRSPVATIVEAKNDNVRYGYGQCIATMVAARLFNERAGHDLGPIHGASTTGTHWKFFRLDQDNLFVDENDYYFSDLGSIAAILFQIVGVNPAPWPVARPVLSRA